MRTEAPSAVVTCGACAHIAVLKPACAGIVLAGEKTIESRPLLNCVPPSGRVREAGTIDFKCWGGPIVARATAAAIRPFAELAARAVRAVLREPKARRPL